MLIHGFTGSYTRHWESPGVITALTQAGYRVIAKCWRAVARSLPALYEVRGESLRAVALPVLAIVGEHDSILEAVNRMAGVVMGLRVVEIAGASHASSVRPSAEPLVRFLDRHRGR